MGKINIEVFRFQVSKRNYATDKEYFQEYLCPSLYVEIYLDYTPLEYIEEFYWGVYKLIGHLFKYHQDNKKSGESKIRDREKVFNNLPDFLHSNKKNYIWQHFADVKGLGDKKTIGGICEVKFECRIHKKLKKEDHLETRMQEIERFKSILADCKTDMLPGTGTMVSNIKVCLPINTFKTSEDFLQWLLSFKLISEWNFFSGTAGYKINFYQGYPNKDAEKKLEDILINYPGFDFDLSIGTGLGRLLQDDLFVPQFKRVNWLTLINEDGVKLLGGLEQLKKNIETKETIKLHLLKHGVIVQAGDHPSIGGKENDLEDYHFVGKMLSPLHYKKHAKDNYFIPGDSIAKEWLYKFD
jgi:hypothetical protein